MPVIDHDTFYAQMKSILKIGHWPLHPLPRLQGRVSNSVIVLTTCICLLLIFSYYYFGFRCIKIYIYKCYNNLGWDTVQAEFWIFSFLFLAYFCQIWHQIFGESEYTILSGWFFKFRYHVNWCQIIHTYCHEFFK